MQGFPVHFGLSGNSILVFDNNQSLWGDVYTKNTETTFHYVLVNPFTAITVKNTLDYTLDYLNYIHNDKDERSYPFNDLQSKVILFVKLLSNQGPTSLRPTMPWFDRNFNNY